MKPLVAIVGRANVGKSRLFNRLVGRTEAIVYDLPGVTRDRHYAPADWCGREFVAIDTGGIDLDPDADLERRITDQSMAAIQEADVIVALFDGREEPTAIDEELIQRLRKLTTPVVFALNKIDGAEQEKIAHSYTRFGLQNVFLLSAEHGRGVDDLLDQILAHFPPAQEFEELSGTLRVSVLGRPNVGKSTLINRLVGEERVIAHEKAGTTRNAIDVDLVHDGKRYTFVDTAGVARHYRVSDRLEKYTALRSLRTIERSHVVCQLIDASDGVTRGDLHLSDYILQEGKGLLLLLNKWDLMKGTDAVAFEEEVRYRLGELHDLPILRISAKQGTHCDKIFQELKKVHDSLSKRLPTAKVNQVLEEALRLHHLPAYRSKQVTISYATQSNTNPPTFVLFSNAPEGIDETYRRYLAKRFKEALQVQGLPLRLLFRKKR